MLQMRLAALVQQRPRASDWPMCSRTGCVIYGCGVAPQVQVPDNGSACWHMGGGRYSVCGGCSPARWLSKGQGRAYCYILAAVVVLEVLLRAVSLAASASLQVLARHCPPPPSDASQQLLRTSRRYPDPCFVRFVTAGVRSRRLLTS